MSDTGTTTAPDVTLPIDAVISGWLRQDADVRAAKLPPTRHRLPPPGGDAEAQTAARIWNAYGGLLEKLAARLGVEPEVGVAVMAVESGGTAFQDGRMVIRFENQVFYDWWGQDHPDVFARHFRFNTPQRWTGHEFRADAGLPWKTFHGKQSAEWEVFEFAQELDRVAARRSISMGLPQIMGFNASALGYGSVDEMFDSFGDPAAGERAQVVGLFDFVKGPRTESEMVEALRRHDWLAFARQYNGSLQAGDYANRLAASFHAARGLVPPDTAIG